MIFDYYVKITKEISVKGSDEESMNNLTNIYENSNID